MSTVCTASERVLPQFEFKDSKVNNLFGFSFVDDSDNQYVQNENYYDSTRVESDDKRINFLVLFSAEENMLDIMSSYNISGVMITFVFDLK